MSNDISNYWSRAMAAENFGMSTQALKKHEDAATENGYGLSENFYKVGNVKLWHKDEWNMLQAARLQKYIDEAKKLGLVVYVEDNRKAARDQYDKGFEDGRHAGINSVASGLEDDTHELNELEDVNTTGYTTGTFVPLDRLGL